MRISVRTPSAVWLVRDIHGLQRAVTLRWSHGPDDPFYSAADYPSGYERIIPKGDIVRLLTDMEIIAWAAT